MGEFETRTPRAPVFGRRAMVVSGHSAATLAGISALKRGGTLVDAMVAASAALAVVLTHATSIGGDCFILYHDAASGRTVGLNASGIAPAAATPEAFGDGMKVRGPQAPVVPGLVRAWEAMHRRYGRLPWRELFEDALDLAENGHPVSRVLAHRIADDRALLASDPGCAALYLPGGRAVSVGDLFRQPALARTLRAVADEGPDSFYRGETARRIGACFAANGGLMREADLAALEPLWVRARGNILSRPSRHGDAAQFLWRAAAHAARRIGGGAGGRARRRSGAAHRFPDERDEGRVRARKAAHRRSARHS